MGCFGSASSKQTDSNDSDDSKSQKRRSDAITKQLQRDKQVSDDDGRLSFSLSSLTIELFERIVEKKLHLSSLYIARAKLLIEFGVQKNGFFIHSLPFLLIFLTFFSCPYGWRRSTGLQGNTSIAATRRWWIGQINNCKANAYSSR